MRPAAILFTDLDGTFIGHHTYEPGPALPALRRLVHHGVEVVFCSSKTWSEQHALMESWRIRVPAIVENGGAIHHSDGRVEVLGADYADVRAATQSAAEELGITIVGQGDMDPRQMAAITGLALESAGRALEREYSEPVIVDPPDQDAFVEAVERRGFHVVRGARFITVVGDHDKGVAVDRIMAEIGNGIPSYAVGDHLNDSEMLAAVDWPMLVQRPDGRWVDVPVPGVARVDAIGPDGWVLAAEHVLAELARMRTVNPSHA